MLYSIINRSYILHYLKSTNNNNSSAVIFNKQEHYNKINTTRPTQRSNTVPTEIEKKGRTFYRRSI